MDRGHDRHQAALQVLSRMEEDLPFVAYQCSHLLTRAFPIQRCPAILLSDSLRAIHQSQRLVIASKRGVEGA